MFVDSDSLLPSSTMPFIKRKTHPIRISQIELANDLKIKDEFEYVANHTMCCIIQQLGNLNSHASDIFHELNVKKVLEIHIIFALKIINNSKILVWKPGWYWRFGVIVVCPCFVIFQNIFLFNIYVCWSFYIFIYYNCVHI